ncbi:MAG: serine/threonine-protein kinase [Acidobacteriota bacterium]
MNLEGQLIAQRLRVLELIGEGGMGDVYLGRDETLNRDVALKVIRSEHRVKSGARQRFLREARILSQLDHPNICRIYDYLETTHFDILVLELIRGRPLSSLLDEAMSYAQSLDIAQQIAAALRAAHSQGVSHGDLKPENVMISAEGEVKVLDFGLAQSVNPDRFAPLGKIEALQDVRDLGPLAASSTLSLILSRGDSGGVSSSSSSSSDNRYILGTPRFMSPEQLQGQPATLASDMYSFGLMFYELFTGAPGYPLNLKLPELLERVEQAKVLPIQGIDKDLAELSTGLTQLEADQRPTAGESLRRLRMIHSKPARRFKLAMGILALFIVVGLTLKYFNDIENQRSVAVEALVEAESARTEAEEVVRFLTELLELSDPTSQGRDVTVRQLLDLSAERIDGELAEQPLTQARLMDTIGTIYRQLGLYEPSRDLLQEALDKRLRNLEANHPAIASSHHELGVLARREGRLAEAEESFQKSLNIREALEEGGGEPLAETINALAVLYAVQGRYPEAEESLLRSLEIRRQALGERDPEVAATLHNLGTLLSLMGQPDNAQLRLEESLEIREEQLGLDHPEVASTLYALAGLDRGAGRLDQAERRYRRVLTIQEEAFGPDHPNVAETVNALAVLEAMREQYPEASELFRRSLAMRRQLFGERHPAVAEVLHNLGNIAALEGRTEEAEPLLRQALELFEEHLGEDHPQVGDVLLSLANYARENRTSTEARPLYDRALEIYSEALGADSPQVQTVRSEIEQLSEGITLASGP